ncbi:tetratricopeptide repeat protein [Puniceicoccaceae bacterium K14]|nr:tetratricopeptide repeat protein [Puniceicoccaceae bacterium K14]
MARSLSIAGLWATLGISLLAKETSSSDGEITFAEHIAPIVYENCAGCHRPGGVGPFSLLGYQEVKRRSRQISEVVSSGFMPPWKPDNNYGPKLIGERKLTEKQIALLQAWHDSGAKPGDLEKAPPEPEFSSNWALGEPDLVITFPEVYRLPEDGTDIYRNFVIPLNLEETKHIRAMELKPSSHLVIHHAVLMVDKTSGSRERDALDPEPGFDGMGFGSSSIPDGQFVGWTPGQSPYEAYPETAWTIEPDSDLVLELHMLPSGKREMVNPSIGLYFSDTPPTRPSQVISLRQFELDIPAGESDYHVEQEMEIPIDVEVAGVYPHAHYIGKELGIYSVFPDGSIHWLIKISDWDFNWQSDYRFVEPMKIPAGSTVHLDYRYDNSEDNPRNPNNPPRHIQSGWKSTDEMAEAMIQLILKDEEEVDIIRNAQAAYDIKSAGGLARYFYNLGSFYELHGSYEKAGDMFFRAIREDNKLASAHYKLGHIAERLGDYQQAESRYNHALATRPELVPAHLGLARVYYHNNSDLLAMWELKKVLNWEDNNYEARLYMARILASQNKTSEAIELLERGRQYHDENPYYRLEIGKLYSELGEYLKGIEHMHVAYKNEIISSQPSSQIDKRKLKSEALYSVGSAFAAMNENQSALKYFAKAIQEMPHHILAYLASAKLLLSEGNETAAINRLVEISNLPLDVRPTKEQISTFDDSAIWKNLLQKLDEE